MSEPATITVTRGPSRGQVFDLDTELVHIGRADSNQIVIDDDGLADHQASIVLRNGRYAIFTPLPDAVSIDGSPIPPQRWVWLPQEARILLGTRTSLQFAMPVSNGEAAAELAADPGPESGKPSRDNATTGGRSPRRGRKRKRQLAKFVTDGSGGARVQLGEDGQLPELSLDEDMTGGQNPQKAPRSNSMLLSLLFVASTATSILLLVADGPIGGGTRADQTTARARLKRILLDAAPPRGQSEATWQLLVRDALQAAARSDRQGELRAYDRLVKLLNAEDRPGNGITGDRSRDEDLLEAIASLKSAGS